MHVVVPNGSWWKKGSSLNLGNLYNQSGLFNQKFSKCVESSILLGIWQSLWCFQYMQFPFFFNRTLAELTSAKIFGLNPGVGLWGTGYGVLISLDHCPLMLTGDLQFQYSTLWALPKLVSPSYLWIYLPKLLLPKLGRPPSLFNSIYFKAPWGSFSGIPDVFCA